MKFHFLIPEKILEVLPELEELILLEESMQDVKGYYPERLREVLSVISMNTDKTGRSPVKMQYLRSIVPQADKYLNALRSLGVIERGESFKPNVTSYKYRYMPAYESKYKRIPVKCSKMKRRIEAANTKNLRQLKRHNSKKYPRQNALIRAIKMDPAVLEFIDNISKEERQKYALARAVNIMNGYISY